MNIVLLESLGVPQGLLDSYRSQIEAAGHRFTVYERTSDVETLKEEVRDADVLILANMPLPASVLDQADHLHYIDVAFTGVDHIPVKEALHRSIAISNASGYATESVAELAIAMMILLARKVPALQQACREGKAKGRLEGWTLQNRTVGIAGAGKIGLRTAQLAKSMGARVLAFNRSQIHCDWIDEQVPLEKLLQESDILSLHLPLTDQTRGLIGKKELECMKPGAIVINTARGPILDNNALAALLENGHLAGAGIDVFDQEPPLPLDLPLLKAPNTILTPHIAYDSEQSMKERAEIVFDNLFSWLNGTIKNEIKAG